MKITLIVATSQDTFINPLGATLTSEWTSAADKKNYSALLKRYKLQLMGINTFEAYKDGFKPSSQYRRIIFTHRPSEYREVPDKIEFTDEPIKQVLLRLADDGYKHGVLLGGGELYTEFLDAGLVDEIYQTVEPLRFGEGIPFLTDGHTMQDYAYLRLESSVPLNSEGTMLRHYIRN